jgi:hypothetical protein
MRIFLMSALRQIGFVEWEFGFYGGALSGFGIDCERAAEAADALFHAKDAHAAVSCGIETVAIVGDLNGDFIGILGDGDFRVFGGGVGGGVVESFLDQAVNGDFGFVAEIFGHIFGLDFGLHFDFHVATA